MEVEQEGTRTEEREEATEQGDGEERRHMNRGNKNSFEGEEKGSRDKSARQEEQVANTRI